MRTSNDGAVAVTSSATSGTRRVRRGIAAVLIVAALAVTIVGWSTGLSSWNSRAIVLSLDLVLLLPAVLVLGTPPPPWTRVISCRLCLPLGVASRGGST